MVNLGDVPSWIAAGGAIGAFGAALWALRAQRGEIRALRDQLGTANVVVDLRRDVDSAHMRRLMVRNTGPGVARDITVDQTPKSSNTFQVGILEGWAPNPLTLLPGQEFAVRASGPALGSESIASVILDWRDDTGSRHASIAVDFSLPAEP